MTYCTCQQGAAPHNSIFKFLFLSITSSGYVTIST